MEKMIVLFWPEGSTACLYCKGENLEAFHAKTSFLDDWKAAPSYPHNPSRKPVFWVWEGTVNDGWSFPSFDGTWRPLNDKELKAIQEQRDPYAHTEEKETEDKWASLFGGFAPGSSDGKSTAVMEDDNNHSGVGQFYDVHLKTIGPYKINIIKDVRSYTGLGLKETKDLVESAPCIIMRAVTKSAAQKLIAELQRDGATTDMTLHPSGSINNSTPNRFDVILTSYPPGKKIDAIKVLRTHCKQYLGLKDAKDLVESSPCCVDPAVKKADADTLIYLLKEIGADGYRTNHIAGLPINYSVILGGFSSTMKVQVIRIVCDFVTKSLIEAKILVEGAKPICIAKELTEAQAKKIVLNLQTVGAVAEINKDDYDR